VLGPASSKLAILNELRAQEDVPILCVGDRGRWPGNDHELLRQPWSLSVDETSPDPETCWAVSAPGRRGPPATLEILCAVEITGAWGRFTL
jgi:hypothetical protein